MNSYIVLHQKSYSSQKDLQILECPVRDEAGNIPHYFSRMIEVKPGDCTFHYEDGHIRAVSFAHNQFYEYFCEKRQVLLFRIPVTYYELEQSIHIRSHWNIINELLPENYSAFHKDSHENNGYLYPCDERLALYFSELIIEQNKHSSLLDLLNKTEQAAITKIRIGHADYKKKLMHVWGHECALCKLDFAPMLRASHSKPWKHCLPSERTDQYNGILLCANHDALYDQGYVTVTEKGEVLISKKIECQNITIPTKLISIDPQNEPYFLWHRIYVFKK